MNMKRKDVKIWGNDEGGGGGERPV